MNAAWAAPAAPKPHNIPPPPPEALDPDLLAGIAAYRRHPYQRNLPPADSLWSEGDTHLLAFGTAGPPILFIPSLINRATILDLMPGHSMLRWLAEQGMRPFLLDWGWPGETERRFNLTDYVAGRLERAVAALRSHLLLQRSTTSPRKSSAPPRIALAGYCMGGLLALATAQRQPDAFSALMLLATPWDFHQGAPLHAPWMKHLPSLLGPILDQTGAVPTDLLQILFALIDPADIPNKYRAFGQLDPASPRAQLFVALEDWLNDGVPLAAPVARDIFPDWYGHNLPARHEWRIAGLPVMPEQVSMPSFVAVPMRDRLVPPPSALPLATLIPHATLHRPQAGHVGMVAGTKAHTELWNPLRQWLSRL